MHMGRKRPGRRARRGGGKVRVGVACCLALLALAGLALGASTSALATAEGREGAGEPASIAGDAADGEGATGGGAAQALPDTVAPKVISICADRPVSVRTPDRAVFDAPTTLLVTVAEGELDPAASQVQVNGEPRAVEWERAGQEIWQAQVPLPAETPCAVTVAAVDCAGNASGPVDAQGLQGIGVDATGARLAENRLLADVSAPQVWLEASQPCAASAGSTDWFSAEADLTMTVRVIDATASPEGVEVRADGAAVEGLAWEEDAPGSLCARLVFGEGEHSLEVRATDLVGRETSCAYGEETRDSAGRSLDGQRFSLDLTAPRVDAVTVTGEPSAVEDAGGFVWFSQPAALRFAVSDAGGLARASLEGAEGLELDGAVEPGAQRAELSLDLAEGRPLTSDAQLVVVDLAGNSRSWSLGSVGWEQTAAGALPSSNAEAGGLGHPRALEADAIAPVLALSGAEGGTFYRQVVDLRLEVREQSLPRILELDPGRALLVIERFEPGSQEVAERTEVPVSALAWDGGAACWAWDGRLGDEGRYRIRSALEDPAGHVGSDEVSDAVVDLTPPQVTIAFDDGAEVRHGCYCNQPRRAVVTIDEPWFEEGLATIETSGEASGWRSDGSLHTAEVRFSSEGEQALAVSVADQAGNSSGRQAVDPFVIDLTPPQAELEGLVDGGAYAGEVSGRVRFSDVVGLDAESEQVEVVGARRGRVAEMTATPDADPEAREGSFSLGEFPHDLAIDDVYTVSAEASDLAGNKCRLTQTFSVNRYGSTFRVLSPPEVGGYVREPPEVTIEEINVSGSEPERCQVLVTRGSETYQLEAAAGPGEGTGWWREESTEEGWSACRYLVPRENFTQDGTYRVAVFSVDAANNSNLSTRSGPTGEAAQVAFTVDGTPPVISGLEQVQGHAFTLANPAQGQEVRFSVVDNTGVASVEALLDGEPIEVEKADEGVWAVRLPVRGPVAQSLTVTATDKAGGTARARADGVVVTADTPSHLAWAPPALGAVAAASAAAAMVLRRRGRRHREG